MSVGKKYETVPEAKIVFNESMNSCDHDQRRPLDTGELVSSRLTHNFPSLMDKSIAFL